MKSHRTCQKCEVRGRSGNSVKFSRQDGQYLHGGCRVEYRGHGGDPYSHGKINRDYAKSEGSKERLANAALRAGKNTGSARSTLRGIEVSRMARAKALEAARVVAAEMEAEVT